MKAWEGDWQKRVKERIRNAGYASVTEYLTANPSATLVALADRLGPEDVAAVQLEKLFRAEAGSDPQAIANFARSVLARAILAVMPSGWGKDEEIAHVYGSWSGALGETFYDAIDRVWAALDSVASTGWRPSGPEDAVLLEAFKAWEK